MAEKLPTFLKLRPNNFTPLTRTPWAGKQLAKSLKVDFCAEGEAIGESWEYSVDPDFPSVLEDGAIPLSQWLQSDTAEKLGSVDQVELLIKLINPALPLSLQVHPQDDDPHLQDDECGKPESWLVLDAEPGSGIYIGFRQGVTRGEVESGLRQGQDISALLNFVEVAKGDYFEIKPGVTHAIGPGVVLLEPQRTVPGKKGKTYRMWDWNRTYDSSGQLDPNGSPRELHLEAALAIVDPEAHQGPRFMQAVRSLPVAGGTDGVVIDSYPANAFYQTHRIEWRQSRPLSISVDHTYAVITVLSGEVQADGLTLRRGETAHLPAASFSANLRADPGTEITLVHPAAGHLRYS